MSTHQAAVEAGGPIRCIACGERFDPVAWYHGLCEPCAHGLLEWALIASGHYQPDRSSFLKHAARCRNLWPIPELPSRREAGS